MFKSSTALLLTLALCAPLSNVVAQAQEAKPLQLQANAPDRYVVVKGDTLWGISGKFLQDPWRWPEIWGLNKDQIKNPHWIYPGDVIVLDRNSMKLRLLRSGAAGDAVITDEPCVRTEGESTQKAIRNGKLEPCIREQALSGEMIPTIPAKGIAPFLSQPILIDAKTMANAPRIVATQEGRVNLGAGNLAYVTGMQASDTDTWNIYRTGSSLVDPETGAVLGQEAIFLGTARVIKRGEPATLRLTAARREISAGDQLLPATPPKIFSYSPHAPATQIRARVMSIYDGNVDTRTEFYQGKRDMDDYAYSRYNETGTLSIVSINKGAKDGLDIGAVLALYRGTVLPNDRSSGPFYMGGPRPEPVHLPEERFGLVMIFRVFDNISYGLIVQGQRPVAPGDLLLNP